MHKLIITLILAALVTGCAALLLAENAEARPPKDQVEDIIEKSPQQHFIQCRFEGQLVRGLYSVMLALASVMEGEMPPMDFMGKYIANFYATDKNEEIIAAASAVKALKWIYHTRPTGNVRESEVEYFNLCMNKELPELSAFELEILTDGVPEISL